jgi:hypothetical protein
MVYLDSLKHGTHPIMRPFEAPNLKAAKALLFNEKNGVIPRTRMAGIRVVAVGRTAEEIRANGATNGKGKR